MISRRLCLAAPVLPLLTTSCASLEVSRPTYLAEVLAALETLRSEADLVGRIGEPFRRVRFGEQWLSGMSKAQLSDSVVQHPGNLIDTLSAGTMTLQYTFSYGSPGNALRGALGVCVKDDGDIIGWMYSAPLERYTTRAQLDRSHQR